MTEDKTPKRPPPPPRPQKPEWQVINEDFNGKIPNKSKFNTDKK